MSIEPHFAEIRTIRVEISDSSLQKHVHGYALCQYHLDMMGKWISLSLCSVPVRHAVGYTTLSRKKPVLETNDGRHVPSVPVKPYFGTVCLTGLLTPL
jgi:hypothetical protein